MIVSGTALGRQTGLMLTMDDSVVSPNVQLIKGHAYVPLSDVAALLNRAVVKKGNTYNLAPIPPADKSRRVTGKLGASLTSGAWQLTVLSAEPADSYSQLYGEHKAQLTPVRTGDTLMMVRCRLKNNTSEVQDVSFDRDAAGNTALTDDQGNGYVPLAYDSRNSDYSSNKIPSGTAHDFVVIFSIPTGTHMKDFVYTAGSLSMDKSTDFRVVLTP
jgi:hypothetical protein